MADLLGQVDANEMAARAVLQTVLVCVVREETTIEGIETVIVIIETDVVMTGMTGVGHIATTEMTETEGEDIRSQSYASCSHTREGILLAKEAVRDLHHLDLGVRLLLRGKGLLSKLPFILRTCIC